MKISDRIASARPLATTAMHGRVEALRAAGLPVIDFSIAISHLPAPAAVRDAVRAALDDRTLPYTSVVGAEAIRAGLCAKLARENGIAAHPGEIIVTNGAKQALYEAMYALTDPGDRVIVFRPHWPAYVATAQLLGLEILLVDLPAALDADFMATLAPARLIILNNPHNPTGKVYTRAELEHVRDWAETCGAGVIVDESYELMAFEGAHVSLASLCDWRALGVVTIFSASQSYAMMGWRIGFALAPAPVVEAMQVLQGPITAAAPALSQVAVHSAFAGAVPDGMLDDYRSRRDLAVAMFGTRPWIVMHAPASGPYLWGDIRALTHDTVGFAEALLEQAMVAVMPGEALGVAGFIRVGYISDDVVTLADGIGRILAFGDAFARNLQSAHLTLADV
jgi:aspartate aminotransferase